MKYCPMCGMENIGDADFCKSCGAKFVETTSNYDQPVQQKPSSNRTLQYYAQPYPYSLQSPSRIRKPIMAIAAIGITAVVVIALLFSAGIFTDGLFSETSADSSTTKIPVTGGPTASLQSIATGGNALTTPAEDHTAVYGYYMGQTRIGSISFTNVGEEYYQGTLCNKIEGSGTFDLEIDSYSIRMNFDIEGYESTYDASLRYLDYEITVSYSTMSMGMQGTVDVDRENNEITSTMYTPTTGTISAVITVSDEFWSKTNLQDSLYVGYVKEVAYTTSVSGDDTDVTLRISVTGQEDVTVGKGTYEDCYIVKIEQTIGAVTTTSYMWIDENGVCPKMQLSDNFASLGELIIELEEYYTT